MLAAGAEAIAELHEAELARAVHDHVFGNARAVRRGHGAHEQRLGHEVAIAGGVDAVRGDRDEAERLAQQFARHGERAAGNGAAAEWQRGRPARGGGEARAITIERPEVREQPVCAAHGLRALQVRVRGQHGVGERLRLREQRLLQVAQRRIELRAGVHGPQARRRGHLIVARPSGVQPRRTVPASSCSNRSIMV
jgi:hypothetical protein